MNRVIVSVIVLELAAGGPWGGFPCAAQTLPDPVPIAERALATLSVPGFVDFLAADGEEVWAVNRGKLEVYREGSPRPVATVPFPHPCGGMAVSHGSLWVASCFEQGVCRVDLKTREITATIPTGLADREGELSLAAGADSIWVLSDKLGVLSRIDPGTNQVASRIQVAPNSFAAAFGFGSVWVTNTFAADGSPTGSLQRVDPANQAVVATIPVGRVPRFLAAGEGGIWVLNQGDGTVSRVDPSTNQVTATIDVGMKGSGGDITAGAGHVWVRGSEVLLAVIDPATNRVVRTYGPPAGSGAVRVAGQRVWVTAHEFKTIWILPAAP